MASSSSQLGYDQYLNRSVNVFPNVVSSATGTVIPDGGVDYSQTISTFVTNEDLKSSNFVTGVSGWQIQGDGNVEFNNGVFRGALSATTIDIGGADTTSFHVDIDGNQWLGAATYAAAPFKVSNTGSLTASSVTITGGSISVSTLNGLIQQTNLNVANRGWSQTCIFSVTDADTVAWATGSLTSADGTVYSIAGADTGNMTAKTYIYLDTAVSITTYQTTTTASTAVGDGKVLVAVAQNGTTEATYKVLQEQGGENIDAANIVAGSITANEIAASTITASKMNVTQLSSVAADLGTITAGTVTLTGSGYLRGGQTDFATGTGFFLGYSGDYKFSIGKSTNYLQWDGTYLKIKGSFDVGTGGLINNSSYTVANLPVVSASVGFNSPSGNEY